MKRLGDHMRARREALALTQQEAAAKGGVSLPTWSNLEGGRSAGMSLRTKRGIAIALEWTPGSIDAVTSGGEPTIVDEAPSSPDVMELAERIAKLSDDQRRFVEGAITLAESQ